MIHYMYSKQGWGLTRPKLILSVIGGTQNFKISKRVCEAFKQGLVRAAGSTSAWIITEGTKSGVMKLVGEAVSEVKDSLSPEKKLTVLGICTWGKIAMRNKLKIDIKADLSVSDEFQRMNYVEFPALSMIYNSLYKALVKQRQATNNLKNMKTQKPNVLYNVEPGGYDRFKDLFLDPYHDKFILVDDGTEGKADRQVGFRMRLETALVNEDVNAVTPLVKIVVNGGPSTLGEVREAVKRNIPVLVLDVSC